MNINLNWKGIIITSAVMTVLIIIELFLYSIIPTTFIQIAIITQILLIGILICLKIFSKNTTISNTSKNITVNIAINTIKNLVGNTAPGVYMNGSSMKDSTAFLYKSKSGKSYLSTDTNPQNNGGAFYEVISNTATQIVISQTKQTDILYTDLRFGGFFEYPSDNPNHTPAMQIMMNTPTVTYMTQYACNIKNADNNFITDWNYGSTSSMPSELLTSFCSILENWNTGNGFQLNFSPIDIMSIFDNNGINVNNLNIFIDKFVFIIAGTSFRGMWTPNEWINNASYELMMNTPTVLPTTKYLLADFSKDNYYISTDGLTYKKADLTTGELTDITFIYDYKTGNLPIINIPIDTTINIPIDTISIPVGDTAPGVYMDGSSMQDSTAFLYISKFGKFYLSTDTNPQNNGGAFYEVISNTATQIVISQTKQTDILYTDLRFGGFFEYPSDNPNHTPAMQIMMNTPTVTYMTQYACNIKNADNNFITDWNYGSTSSMPSELLTSFCSILENWNTGNGFQLNFSPIDIMSIFDNNGINVNNLNIFIDKFVFIIAGTSFRGMWTPNEWINNASYELMMNTPTVLPTTKYLLADFSKDNYYISTDGLTYKKADLTTGELTDITFIYDYKTGNLPNIILPTGAEY